jgi:hypothetical protein
MTIYMADTHSLLWAFILININWLTVVTTLVVDFRAMSD